MLAIVIFLNFIEDFISYFHCIFTWRSSVLGCGLVDALGRKLSKKLKLLSSTAVKSCSMEAIGKAVSSGLLSLTQVQSVPKVVALEMQVFQLLPAHHF